MTSQRLSLTQKTSQTQIMKLSQKQIMAMNLIAMGNLELREEIIKKAEENPALEISEDKFTITKSSVHTGKVSSTGVEASEKYQAMLEAAPDKSETLQSHLLHQLNMTKLPENEENLCRKIIENLDENGYHILAPVTLLNKSTGDDENLLKKCITRIQNFDPEGICCNNVTESLEIQAKLKKDSPKIALFILHGRLELLKPPVKEKVFQKLQEIISEKEKMSFWTESDNEINLKKEDISIEKTEEAIKFIQNLDPFPARNYKSASEHFIQPDVYVIQNKNSDELEVMLSNSVLPVLTLAQEFSEEEKSPILTDENKKKIHMQLKEAQDFIDTLDFRQEVLLNSFKQLVKIQKDFFIKGPGHLSPLTQRNFAKIIKVHESTVSRMADSKFLRCDWGTFPIKYFFSNALNTSNEENISTDNVKLEIEKILRENNSSKKKLSDQKIADLLAEKGIKIARRTVSKYRQQLNIASSYER